MSFSYCSIVVSRVSWLSPVLLGQPVGASISLSIVLQVGFCQAFFTVISVLPKNKWMDLLDFHLSFCCTEMSVFCNNSCQCNSSYGFRILQIWKYFLTKFLLLACLTGCQCSIIEEFSQNVFTVGFNKDGCM